MKKILTLFLIFLLLLPVVIAKEEKEEKKESEKEIKESTKSINWGFVRTRLSTNYGEHILSDNSWWGTIEMGYRVRGIGHHDIHWEIEYEIYTYATHVPQPQTGVFQGNDSIYLFDLTQRPIFKPVAGNSYFWPFLLYDTGHWTARLYIDGELTDEEYFEWTHQ